MPGVNRPTTLTDVIATLNQQNTQAQNDVINGLGDFAEMDETVPVTDSMTGTVQLNPTWDQGTWGGFSWS